MKFKNIYKISALLVLYVVLQSRSGGPGAVQSLQVTGAPGSTGMAAGQPGTCANTGCHVSNSFNPSVSLQLLEAGNPVTNYEPGKTYTLRVVTTPGTGNPARYGFQAVALNGANAQAGEWDSPGAGKQLTSLGNRTYVEHSAPSASNSFEMPWIAPAASTGTVTFYSASIASNNNSTSSGDGVASASLAVEESGVNNTSSQQKAYASISILPNPVVDQLHLQITSRVAGSYKIRIINAGGTLTKEIPATLQIGINRTEVQVPDLVPGCYIVQLCGGGQLAAAKMLKI